MISTRQTTPKHTENNTRVSISRRSGGCPVHPRKDTPPPAEPTMRGQDLQYQDLQRKTCSTKCTGITIPPLSETLPLLPQLHTPAGQGAPPKRPSTSHLTVENLSELRRRNGELVGQASQPRLPGGPIQAVVGSSCPSRPSFLVVVSCGRRVAQLLLCVACREPRP